MLTTGEQAQIVYITCFPTPSVPVCNGCCTAPVPCTLCLTTDALMLHKVKHTRTVGCGDGGRGATSTPMAKHNCRTMSNTKWLIRYATHFVYLVQFDPCMMSSQPHIQPHKTFNAKDFETGPHGLSCCILWDAHAKMKTDAATIRACPQ